MIIQNVPNSSGEFLDGFFFPLHEAVFKAGQYDAKDGNNKKNDS
jgi:hypothetical protein